MIAAREFSTRVSIITACPTRPSGGFHAFSYMLGIGRFMNKKVGLDLVLDPYFHPKAVDG